jgi:hypothetical protein
MSLLAFLAVPFRTFHLPALGTKTFGLPINAHCLTASLLTAPGGLGQPSPLTLSPFHLLFC